MSTPVGVIKNFVATLINSKESGDEALNEALKAVGAVNYDVLKSRFSADQSGLSTQDFLEQYCGIRVNNTDTGAITAPTRAAKLPRQLKVSFPKRLRL